MGKSWTKKRWVKAAVLTVGIADCAGIYYANHRLGETVPDDVRYDTLAVTIPQSSNMFQAGDANMFGTPESAPTRSGPALAVIETATPEVAPAIPSIAAPKAAPEVLELAAAPKAGVGAPTIHAPALASAAPVKATAPVKVAAAARVPAPAAHLAAAPAAPAKAAAPAAPSASGRPAAHLALAAPVLHAPVAKAAAPTRAAQPTASPAPHLAQRSLEGPRGASVSRMLAAMQPAAKAAAPAPVAKAHASVLTPHLAKLEKPPAEFHPAASSVTSQHHTAALALGSVAPSAKVKASVHKAPARSAASLAGLVPKARETSEFASAFAGLDAPLSSDQLELALPALDTADAATAADTGLASAASPVLENVIPVAPAELPPVSASADEPAAKL